MALLASSFEGYISIDHRESPGLDGVDAIDGGHRNMLPFVGKGQHFKGATNTCSHCDKVVIKNPNRVRDRGHCSQCDLFICDQCETDFYLTSQCHCWSKRLDTYMKGITNGT